MIEIMTIEDSFILSGKGAVVSGVNPSLDSEGSERVKSMVGRRVRITNVGCDDVVFEVKDVGISESLVGKKNISMLLDSDDLTMLTRGSRVYAT
ncbi:hypothetical protein [Luteibacter jiangsuensis]